MFTEEPKTLETAEEAAAKKKNEEEKGETGEAPVSTNY